MLTIEEVEERVNKIIQEFNDESLRNEEKIHEDLDNLWEAVFRAIAKNRCENPQEYARLVLAPLEISGFTRWYG